YTTDQVPVPPPEPILIPILGLLKLISWSTAKTMAVRTPLCHQHAHGGFTWSTLTAKEITDESIVLPRVSDRFVEACEQRAADPQRQRDVIKVRCRGCRSVNDEAAKFCNQCGEVL